MKRRRTSIVLTLAMLLSMALPGTASAACTTTSTGLYYCYVSRMGPVCTVSPWASVSFGHCFS